MDRRSAAFLTIAAASLLASCSPETETVVEPSVTHSGTDEVSGLAIIPVTVTPRSGSHTFKAQLADTPEAQERGLTGQTKIGPDEAMLFPNAGQAAQVFWNKDASFPVDFVFIGRDGRISNIAPDNEPNSQKQVYSVGTSRATLEIAGGRAAELGLQPGDRVSW